MDVSYVFAGLVVASRDQAASWYARLLGRPADMLPNDAEATWQLTSATSVYLLADADRAGHGVLSLVVDDLQAQLAQITARGIVTGPVTIPRAVICANWAWRSSTTSDRTPWPARSASASRYTDVAEVSCQVASASFGSMSAGRPSRRAYQLAAWSRLATTRPANT